MHVVQLIGSTGLYGAERWVLALMRALEPGRVRSTLINLVDKTSEESDVVKAAVQRQLAAFDLYTAGRFNPWVSVRLARWAKKHDADIIHCHGFKSDMVGLLSARLGGNKVITTPHGWSLETDKKLMVYERLDRRAFGFMDMVCPLSPELAKGIGRDGKKNVRLIINAVDIDEISEVDAAHKPRGDAFQIGYIGQLIERKNLSILLRAAKLLSDAGTRLAVTLIGDGPCRSGLIEEARNLELEKRVVFTGFRSDAVRFLKTFDVLVLPSLVEGMPRCIMEAMAAGLPVVASDIPGNRDLVKHGETGLLFISGDYNDLSKKILYVMRNPAEAENLTRKAKERVAREFSSRRMAEEYTQLYSELVPK